jgi:hypothetical protein
MDMDIEYLDEELDDIEYTEILSFEEMSRINPSFIALDKEEIYNNLYVFFNDKKKSNLLRNLFYEILENSESKKGKIKDYSNYIFAAEGELENYGDDGDGGDGGDGDSESGGSGDPKDAVYNFITKYNNKSDLREFTKRKFAVSYDRKSTKIRLKPTHNTSIIISDAADAAAADAKDFPKYHQIVKDYPVIKCASVDKVENIYNINDTGDDDIPILGAYYKIPTATVNDYMYAKIASHLLNSVNTNYKQAAAGAADICDLIKNTRPEIAMSIKEIDSNKEAFYLDYSNINNIFKKYDYSLDFISEKDLEILTDTMYSIIKGEKERKSGSQRPFKIRAPVLIAKKLTFYDNIEKVLKVINLSPQVKSFLEKTKDIILKYKSDIIQSEVISLKNYNVYDIIQQINHSDITIEEIIEELKMTIKTINTDNALETINDILEAEANLGDIKEGCEVVRREFVYSREHIFDYDKDGKKYVISKRENKAISDGNDIDNYEGLDDDDDIIDDENKGIANASNGDDGGGGGGAGGGGAAGAGVAVAINNNYDINRYIANIHFRNEKGFIEILRIILELIKKVNDIANVDIDYDALSNHIFKKYSSILTITRYEIYLKKLKKLKMNIDDTKKSAKKYAERQPLYLELCLTFNKSNLDKRHKWYEDIKKAVAEDFIDKAHIEIVKTANKEFVVAINTIFYEAICFWMVDTQENILKNNITLNANFLNPRHIDTLNSKGLLYYIIEVITDHFKLGSGSGGSGGGDDNEYLINTEALQKTLVNIIKNAYKDKGEAILNELLTKKDIGAKNRCSADRHRYTDEEQYYIDKLLMTPNNNSKYEKIHKYIQGCCLRRLEPNFNDTADFDSEIIKLKEQYSKVNLNNKERDTRYTPPRTKRGTKAKGKAAAAKDIEYDSDASDASDADAADAADIYANEVRDKVKDIKYVIKKPFVYNFKNYGVDEWLEEMRDRSPLLPSILIDNIKNYNIDAVKNSITDNIKRLKNIKSNISGDFLNCAYINYKEILLNICKILYVSGSSGSGGSGGSGGTEVLQEKIMNSIKDIKKMSKHLYDLNKNYNEEDEVLVNIINLAVIANALNSPDLLGVENIPKKFLADKADKLYDYLKTYLEGDYNKFLSPEEITVFLNKKREEYKITKLKQNEDLDVEQHEIRRQMKAAGIKDAYNEVKDNASGDASGGDDDAAGDVGGDNGGDARDGGDGDTGNITDAYKNEEKDDDYNSKDNDNYNIYDDNDNDE